MLQDAYKDGLMIKHCLTEYDLPDVMLDLIVVIYGLTDHKFNEESYKAIVHALRERCDYSLMTANVACMYGALLDVLYENPLSKIYHLIELVDVFRGTGFRSRVSNMMALGLLNDDSVDPEELSAKTLKLYHCIHEKHGFITGEDDYLSTMYMAGMDQDVEQLINESEGCYHELARHSFGKGNALQALSHQITLLDHMDRESVIKELDRWHRLFKERNIKTNSSQILLYGILAIFDFDEEIFMMNLEASMNEAQSINDDNRVHALQRSAIVLEEIKKMMAMPFEDLSLPVKRYLKASLLMLLTNYLFRERLI